MYIKDTHGKSYIPLYAKEMRKRLSSLMVQMMMYEYNRVRDKQFVRELLLCRVHLTMLTSALICDTPITKLLKLVMVDLPCQKNEYCIHTTTHDDVTYRTRYATEIDRGGEILGPKTSIVNDNLVIVDAALDFNSPSHYDEYIVLGSADVYVTQIGGSDYVSYVHIDTPISKTMVPHYRLCDIEGPINIGGFIAPLPALFKGAIKWHRNHGLNNVCEALPDYRAVRFYMERRPICAREVRLLIYCVIHGIRISCASYSDLMRQLTLLPIVRDNDIFSCGGYVRSDFTDTNHGVGPEWLNTYNVLFE